MIRRAFTLIGLGLLLAGCAAKAPMVARPASVIPHEPPRGEPSAFLNLRGPALRAALGAPAFVRKDGATEMWRYDGAACRAFFFLYGEKDGPVVRHVETLPHGVNAAADSACLTALRVSPAKTS